MMKELRWRLIMQEIWKDICNYEGLYQISNLGNIRRIHKDYRCPKYYYLNKRLEKNGYLRVALSKKQKRKFYSVHRLVAETFIKNPYNPFPLALNPK